MTINENNMINNDIHLEFCVRFTRGADNWKTGVDNKIMDNNEIINFMIKRVNKSGRLVYPSLDYRIFTSKLFYDKIELSIEAYFKPANINFLNYSKHDENLYGINIFKIISLEDVINKKSDTKKYILLTCVESTYNNKDTIENKKRYNLLLDLFYRASNKRFKTPESLNEYFNLCQSVANKKIC